MQPCPLPRRPSALAYALMGRSFPARLPQARVKDVVVNLASWPGGTMPFRVPVTTELGVVRMAEPARNRLLVAALGAALGWPWLGNEVQVAVLAPAFVMHAAPLAMGPGLLAVVNGALSASGAAVDADPYRDRGSHVAGLAPALEVGVAPGARCERPAATLDTAGIGLPLSPVCRLPPHANDALSVGGVAWLEVPSRAWPSGEIPDGALSAGARPVSGKGRGAILIHVVLVLSGRQALAVCNHRQGAYPNILPKTADISGDKRPGVTPRQRHRTPFRSVVTPSP